MEHLSRQQPSPAAGGRARRPRPATGEERRAGILARLRSGGGPVRAADLAAAFGVSRQVIVGDVAILRAEGHPVVGTPRGYVLLEPAPAPGPQAVFACRHDRRGTRAELLAMVEAGCTVVDVIVEHPLYGELRGNLMLATRDDVERFLRALRAGETELLSSLTGGVHLHTVAAPSFEALSRAREALRRKGFLLPSSGPGGPS
ncbi:MAG TPA: transcription repressor NadR [Actinomycetota bacterium]|nr:transcription repressor NadR [Actinomycetota bacterium]